jgi:hypothetical protein
MGLDARIDHGYVNVYDSNANNSLVVQIHGGSGIIESAVVIADKEVVVTYQHPMPTKVFDLKGKLLRTM